MGRELLEGIQQVQSKLGRKITNEAELSNELLNGVILPYLRKHVGLLADVKLERTIKRGRLDARIGNLIIEFEGPDKGVEKGIEQCIQYVKEFRSKGQIVSSFVTDGHLGVFVSSQCDVGPVQELIDIADEIQERLYRAALLPVEPEDLLRILSPKSDIAVSHIKYLFEVFQKYQTEPFISECYDLWNRVFGVSANLSSEAIKDIRKYTNQIGIVLENRVEVLEFIFITQTYLTIYMKLLVAVIAVNRGLVRATTIPEILSIRPLEGFELLSERIPFLRKAFEHDAFSWLYTQQKKMQMYQKGYPASLKGSLKFLTN